MTSRATSAIPSSAACAERISVLGCPVDVLTRTQAVDTVASWIDAGARPRWVMPVNAAKVISLRRDAVLRAYADRAALVIADGAGVLWAARRAGTPLPERVCGIDLATDLLAMSARRGWRPFLLGGRKETPVLAAERLREIHPDLSLAGVRHGYFDALEERGVAEEIAATCPSFVLVGLGTPRQEGFILRWAETLGAPLLIGVGGTLDVLAASTRRAPAWARERGLEWAWRSMVEPRRIPTRRTLRTLAFAARVLLQKGTSF